MILPDKLNFNKIFLHNASESVTGFSVMNANNLLIRLGLALRQILINPIRVILFPLQGLDS